MKIWQDGYYGGDIFIPILILIPNRKNRKFSILIPLPSQYEDFLSKQKQVRTIPTMTSLFAISICTTYICVCQNDDDNCLLYPKFSSCTPILDVKLQNYLLFFFNHELHPSAPSLYFCRRSYIFCIGQWEQKLWTVIRKAFIPATQSVAKPFIFPWFPSDYVLIFI